MAKFFLGFVVGINATLLLVLVSSPPVTAWFRERQRRANAKRSRRNA